MRVRWFLLRDCWNEHHSKLTRKKARHLASSWSFWDPSECGGYRAANRPKSKERGTLAGTGEMCALDTGALAD